MSTMNEPLMENNPNKPAPETGVKKYVGIVARWSFFIFSIIAILMSFGHLHIKFKDVKCKDQVYGANTYKKHDGIRCVGRNLAWLEYDNGLKFDSNAADWRSVVSFVPAVFFDVWTPFVFAWFSFFQCFKNYKVNLITGTWFKTLLYIVVWHLFGIIGYAANWGVLCGLWGILLLGLLYALMTIICLFDGLNETQHNTTLQLDIEEMIMTATNKIGLTNFNIGKSSTSQNNYSAPPGNNNNNNDINNPNPNQNNIGSSNQQPQGYQSQGYQSSELDNSNNNNYQQQNEYQPFQAPQPVDPPPTYQEDPQNEQLN